MPYSVQELNSIASDNIRLAKSLADWQNSEMVIYQGWLATAFLWVAKQFGLRRVVIHPKGMTNIINALLNGGNVLQQIAREQDAPRMEHTQSV